MKNVVIVLFVLFAFFLAFVEAGAGSHSSTTGNFWTPEMKKLAGSLVFSLFLMIILPMTIHVVDEQLGYFFLFLGGAILIFAMSLGIVKYEHGYFVQKFMPHGESFDDFLKEVGTFDKTFTNTFSQKKGKELEDFLNKVYKEVDEKQKDAFLSALKEWLGATGVSLKESKVSLHDDKQNPKGEKAIKPFIYQWKVRHFETFLNHCFERLPHSDQTAFFDALKKLFGEKNVTQVAHSIPHHPVEIRLDQNTSYSYAPESLEYQLAKSYVNHSYTEGHPHHLVELLKEPWMLLICFFSLSLLAFVFQANIKNFFASMAQSVKPEIMIFWFVLIVGMMGSISVVVIATVGGIFFSTLSKIVRKDYTAPVICFSANIGISALLTTVGEPLSLFVARNLGEGTPYLMKTFFVAVIINAVLLAFLAHYYAKKAPDLEKTTEEIMVEDVKIAKKAEEKAKKEISEARQAELAIIREVTEAKNALKRAQQVLSNTKYRKGLDKAGKLEMVQKIDKENNNAFAILENVEIQNKDLFKTIENYDKETLEALEAAENFESAGKEAFKAVESFEEEQHNFGHELDRILHATAKLAFFVWGLLFFGEGVKPIAAKLITEFSEYTLFFANIISAVADNALLGLLEIQNGMAQATVFTLTLSLAFWGVAMVPGNVCNIVLKEAMHIKFVTWAKYGIPISFILCVVNFIIVLLAHRMPMLFFPFGS